MKDGGVGRAHIVRWPKSISTGVLVSTMGLAWDEAMVYLMEGAPLTGFCGPRAVTSVIHGCHAYISACYAVMPISLHATCRH